MSFPQYPVYRDSGSPWLGKIPEHWSVVSMRWISTRYSGGTPDKTTERYWVDGTIPWLNSGSVNSPLITEPSAFITEEAFESSSAKWIPAGALVVALAGQGKTKGMVAQLGISTTSNQSMAAIVPKREIDARFLFWWLRSNYQNIRNMAGGDLRDGLNLDLLASIPCPLLPIAEQHAIASLLDRETAKIDVLVAEQEKLITLLREKRQTVISEAVTKGLDPTVPMKDSGVEWLGAVPAHWCVDRLKASISSCRNGIWGDEAQDDENDIPCVRVADFDRQRLRVELRLPTIRNVTEKERINRVLRRGNLLLEKSGGGESQPVGCVVLYDDDQPAVCSNFLAKIELASGMNPSYWRYVHAAAYAVRLTIGSINQTSGIQNLDQDRYFNERAAFPPELEQIAIGDFLDSETAKFDELVTEAQSAIALFQERRAALVSAAVTGQIDLRESVVTQR